MLTLAVYMPTGTGDPKQTAGHLGREAPFVQLEVSVFADWEKAIKVHGN